MKLLLFFEPQASRGENIKSSPIMVKHHFLLLRHCVRSTTDSVDVGLPGYSHNLADYVGNAELPDWHVPTKWCTEQGLDLIANNGAWLVSAGLVDAKTHVEIISDDANRDIDTAFSLSHGMLDEVNWFVKKNNNNNQNADNVDSGLDLMRIKTFMFHPEEICTYIEGNSEKQVQGRFDHLRRPALSFEQGLSLLEQVVGRGRVGSLVEYFADDTVTLDYDHEKLTGAANLLRNLSETVFFAKAGLAANTFAAGATVQQVYQLMQFHDWYRAVMDVGDNWAGMAGAAWAKVALTVLQQGALYDTVPRPNQQDTMSIFTGHDVDLDTLATALGVRWDPPEYQTYPEFMTTPPGSGIHIVRDTETQEIQVSFMYPVYHKEVHEEWVTDHSGVLKEIPVLWANEDKNAASWNQQPIPSIQDLESHFLSRLSRFAGATECYEATALELQRTMPQAQSVSTSELSSSTSIKHYHVAAIAIPAAIAALALLVFSRRFFFGCHDSQKECLNNSSSANPLTLSIHSDRVIHSDSDAHSPEELQSSSPSSPDNDDSSGGELA